MIVVTKGIKRKTELINGVGEFQTYLNIVLEQFDIKDNITDISYDGGTKYGVYCSGKPTVSPIDLSGVETDPLTNDLISFKIDLADNSIRTKVYYIGNINNIEFHRPIAGTGVYLDSNDFTIYYPTSGELPTGDIQGALTQKGFSATTFYSDGTTSDESVYTQDGYVPD